MSANDAVITEHVMRSFVQKQSNRDIEFWDWKVPYHFHQNFKNRDKIRVEKTINSFNNMADDEKLDINFVPVERSEDGTICDRIYIRFVWHPQETKSNGIGTKSTQLETERFYDVFISNTALFDTTLIVHELMHVLGFAHEHQRPDLEMTLVSIQNQSSVSRTTEEFINNNILTILDLLPLTPLDYNSIMMYPNPAVLPDHTKITFLIEPRKIQRSGSDTFVNNGRKIGDTSSMIKTIEDLGIILF